MKIKTDNEITEVVMQSVEFLKEFKEELRTKYDVPFMKRIKKGK